jgi:hypothetical protein
MPSSNGGGGGGFLLFPSSSHNVPQILNMFPNMFPIAPHYISHNPLP